jgi:hypothetical protein
VLKRFLDDGPPGVPDGVTPFFVEAGAAPTAGNAPYPPGSIIRFGTTYYLQTGTLAAPVWTSLATLITPAVLALLTTGLLKNTAGVLSAAVAGVDYSKGPWKLFPTTRLAAANQVMSHAVADAEANGLWRATGRLLNNTAGNLTCTVKINGSATNVKNVDMSGSQSGGSAASTNNRCGFIRATTGTAFYTLAMHTAKLAGGFRRVGILTMADFDGATNREIIVGNFCFDDTATVITSIDIDGGVANAFAIGSEALIEEGLAG